MTALSAAAARDGRKLGEIRQFPMKASTTIYKGSSVMINTSGTAEPSAVAATARIVVGVALETVTSAASGTSYISAQEGEYLFAGTNVDANMIGELCYMADDNTVDDNDSITTNACVGGLIVERVSSSSVWVDVRSAYGAGAALAS